jgi:hypothetical protein
MSPRRASGRAGRRAVSRRAIGFPSQPGLLSTVKPDGVEAVKSREESTSRNEARVRPAAAPAAPPEALRFWHNPQARAAPRAGRSGGAQWCLSMAGDYPLLDVFWTMVMFFAWVIWFWLLIRCFADIFRRRDIGGGGRSCG